MKASDFYFNMVEYEDREEDEPEYIFLITPKDDYDINGEVSGQSDVPDNLRPENFDEMMESVYVYLDDDTCEFLDPKKGREVLLSAGFIEKDMKYPY